MLICSPIRLAIGGPGELLKPLTELHELNTLIINLQCNKIGDPGARGLYKCIKQLNVKTNIELNLK